MGLDFSASTTPAAATSATASAKALATAKHNSAYQTKIEELVREFITTEFRQPLRAQERRFREFGKRCDLSSQFKEYDDNERDLIDSFMKFPFDSLKQSSIDTYLKTGKREPIDVYFSRDSRVSLYISVCKVVFGCRDDQIEYVRSFPYHGKVLMQVTPFKRNLLAWNSELTALQSTEASTTTASVESAEASASALESESGQEMILQI